MEDKKEGIIRTALLFPFRVVSNLLTSLTMDDKGYSLKKILAVMGTIEGIRVTEKHACKENAISFLIVWLIWVGILVGIYSIKDISNALSTIKGTITKGENKEVIEAKIQNT